MNCLLWNIRGIGKGEKALSIRSIVKSKDIAFMGLVETKHRKPFKSRIKRLWGNDDYEFCEVFASDTNSGGLVVVWDKHSFNASNKHVGDRWVLIEGIIIKNNFQCCIGVIYGHNDGLRRVAMFDEIKQRASHINKPILVMGDFNVILHPRERTGSVTCVRSMREFSEWINDLQLLDIPLQGMRFTWRRNESKSKLDRVLCDHNWLTNFPNMLLKGLCRSFSDHNPLLLTMDVCPNWGPKPFRCQDAWFLHPQFRSFLVEEWRNTPAVPLHTKLKILKAPIRCWRRQKFDLMDKKIADLEKAIHELEKAAETRTLDNMEKARLNAANSMLSPWLIRRERLWRQRARSYGFSKKDQNTKFFHATTLLRKKKQGISKIKINGNSVEGILNIKQTVREFFVNRFTQEAIPDFDFDMDSHKKISEEQARNLELIPSREEIKKAVWACGIDKAPGFDGFNFRFIREMWEEMKEEIFETITNFFRVGGSLRHLNVTWVTLIPKKENPTAIEDFRPISMVGSIYKIIAKILSSRLKDVITPLIDETQNAFVGNRQILDGVLIANESLRWLKNNRISGALIKIDFQMAYDSINWVFLRKVLEKLGFGRRWISWIMECVTSASMSVLLNGSPLQPFKMEKGLRQGDPLSPYLFILVSEALLHFLKKAHELNMIEDVSIGKTKVSLKHLQFADDILFFTPRNPTCIINYFRILDVFALMSGLSINYNKSTFISWKEEDFPWVNDMANMVGCGHVRPPFSYLGFPLGANFNTCAAWKPILRNIENRLASWKVKLLSRAGRLTLIKCVLNSLPVYFMSLFRMPKKIAAQIVKMQRRFFWGGSNEGSTTRPTVKWANIELPKELGGLGVGNILHKNLILLFKWWWRFSETDNSLWKRIIKSVHNIQGEKASLTNFSKAKTGIWANLLTDDPGTVKVRKIIQEGMSLRVGDGTSILFWHDRWCEIGVLKDIYPRLFTVSLQKNCEVCQMGEWVENSWVWNLDWRRRLYEWEMEEVRTMQIIIDQNKPKRELHQGVLWKNKEVTSYPTTDIYATLNETLAPSIPKSIMSVVWQKFIPPRAQLTVWMAFKERLKTADFLVEKGVISVQNAGCPFCRSELETNSHILFTCRFAWSTWMEMLKWWNISAPLHMSFSNFSCQWLGLINDRKCKDIWALSLGCVIWSLWYERNQIKFDSKSANFHNFITSLKLRIGFWTKELMGYSGCAPNIIFNADSFLLRA